MENLEIINHKKITTLRQTNKKIYKIIYEYRWKTKNNNKLHDVNVNENPCGHFIKHMSCMYETEKQLHENSRR
jgi:hypothetical protein